MIRKRGTFKHQKYSRVRGKSNKSALDSRAIFNFVDKNDPDYKRPCGKDYTERQRKLLSGEIEWQTTRLTDIRALLDKARLLNDTSAIKKAEELYALKVKQRENKYVPNLTEEEARDILRNLTPWKGGAVAPAQTTQDLEE